MFFSLTNVKISLKILIGKEGKNISQKLLGRGVWEEICDGYILSQVLSNNDFCSGLV